MPSSVTNTSCPMGALKPCSGPSGDPFSSWPIWLSIFLGMVLLATLMAIHHKCKKKKRAVASQNPPPSRPVVVQSTAEGTHAFYSNFEQYFDANKRFVANSNNLNDINSNKFILEPNRINSGDSVSADPMHGGPSPRRPPPYSDVNYASSNYNAADKTVNGLLQPSNLSTISSNKQRQEDDFNEAMNMIRPMQPAYLAPGTPITFYPQHQPVQSNHPSPSSSLNRELNQNASTRYNRELSVGHM